MTQIRGTKGDIAEVDKENRLATFSIVVPEDRHRNDEGGVYSIYFEVTPAAADDYFFYIKNDGISNINITDIRIKSSVVTDIYYEYVSGTPVFVTGTEAAVVNRNLGRPNNLVATPIFDTDITGLTLIDTIFFDACDTVEKLQHLRTSSNIIIPQGQAVAFRRQAATGSIKCVASVVVQE